MTRTTYTRPPISARREALLRRAMDKLTPPLTLAQLTAARRYLEVCYGRQGRGMDFFHRANVGAALSATTRAAEAWTTGDMVQMAEDAEVARLKILWVGAT